MSPRRRGGFLIYPPCIFHKGCVNVMLFFHRGCLKVGFDFDRWPAQRSNELLWWITFSSINLWLVQLLDQWVFKHDPVSLKL